MGDWEQILRELTEIDMRHGGFIQSALDEIESLRQQLAAALAACEEKDHAIKSALFDHSLDFSIGDSSIIDLKEALTIKPDASALKVHDDALIEQCAVAAWNHYAEVCKIQGVNPHHYGEWIASAAIRELKHK